MKAEGFYVLWTKTTIGVIHFILLNSNSPLYTQKKLTRI